MTKVKEEEYDKETTNNHFSITGTGCHNLDSWISKQRNQKVVFESDLCSDDGLSETVLI